MDTNRGLRNNIYNHMIFDNPDKNKVMGKGFPNKWCCENGLTMCRKLKLVASLALYTKITQDGLKT